MKKLFIAFFLMGQALAQTSPEGLGITSPKAIVAEEAEVEAPKKNIIQTGKFKTESCKWVSDMPRRLIFGPGCNADRKSMLCVGYVVCETNDASGAKFIRQSTCGSENCGEDKAVACTKQASYGSCQPENNTKTISDKVINATTIED